MQTQTTHPGIIQEGGVQYKIANLQNKTLHYDFTKTLHYLNAKGKILFGKHFKIYKSDVALLHKLVCYRIGDQATCKQYNIDINKGLLLSGPVGCGKTSIITLLKYITPHLKNYHVIPARNITFGFNHLGYKTITDYGESNHYCFDDIGVEPEGKYYGQKCNVLGEILLSRYEIFLKAKKIKNRGQRIKTHATTNLNADELEEHYGNRVRSRMREMFNLISFDANAKDKRS